MIRVRVVKKIPLYISEQFDIHFVRSILPGVSILQDITDCNCVDGDLELVVSQVSGRYRSVAAITSYNRYTRRKISCVIGKSFSGTPFSAAAWREHIGALICKIQPHAGETT